MPSTGISRGERATPTASSRQGREGEAAGPGNSGTCPRALCHYCVMERSTGTDKFGSVKVPLEQTISIDRAVERSSVAEMTPRKSRIPFERD